MRELKDYVLKRLLSRYIVGHSLGDAIPAVRRVVRAGWNATICPWNFPGDAPEDVAARYLQSLHALARFDGRGYLSVKAPALGYDFSLLKKVLDAARPSGMRVHFDAQQPETAAATRELVEMAWRYYPLVSFTLPARWRRSFEDADWAISREIPVRVVKGQWEDPEAPDLDAGESFLALVDRLAGRAAHVDVATHDRPLARQSLQILAERQTSSRLEVLYGLPLGVTKEAEKLGVGVTMYIPFGRACLPYDIYVLRRRPQIFKWMLRDFLLGNRFQLP